MEKLVGTSTSLICRYVGALSMMKAVGSRFSHILVTISINRLKYTARWLGWWSVHFRCGGPVFESWPRQSDVEKTGNFQLPAWRLVIGCSGRTG